jgi:hypothetical protein
VGRGVRRDGRASSVGRAADVVVVLGPSNAGAILRAAEVGWGLRALKLAGVVFAEAGWAKPVFAAGVVGEDPSSNGPAMRCRTPFRSTMQERDPKWNISPALKVIRVLKTIAMESSWINVAPPTWRASCRCL